MALSEQGGGGDAGMRGARVARAKRLRVPSPSQRYALGPSLSHFVLWDSHISEQPPCLCIVLEADPAVMHGDGTGRSFGGIALPAAEASDDPGEPGEGSGWMPVGLCDGRAFELAMQAVDEGQEVGIDGVEGGPRAAVARGDQLHDPGRGDGCQSDELGERRGAVDLTGLDVETLELERA